MRLIKTKVFLPSDDHSRVWLSCVGPLVCMLPNTNYLVSNQLAFSVTDERDSRNRRVHSIWYLSFYFLGFITYANYVFD
jgi:hypothetical protein